NRPHDFIAEHIAVDLDPRRSGEIKVEKLQLVGGQTWLKLSAPATYANRNLIVRDIVLADNERFRSVDFDASQIAARKLGIKFDFIWADRRSCRAIFTISDVHRRRWSWRRPCRI